MKYFFLSFFILFLVVGCTTVVEEVNTDDTNTDEIDTEELADWQDIELKDISSGETFTVNQFSKPVLLESFAVWCPTCTRQQNEIKKLHQNVGDEIISISIDTDPNEDEAKISAHIERNGFDWRYVVSPIEFTQSLIDQFDVGIVNAPSAPVVLICNGKALKLENGVKTASELKKHVEDQC
tara:strand:+ start:707 stop:1249 length:543 start_codon:yes stop_codon:yes gene_type:complete